MNLEQKLVSVNITKFRIIFKTKEYYSKEYSKKILSNQKWFLIETFY